MIRKALLGLVLAVALGCGCGQSEAVQSRWAPPMAAQPKPASRSARQEVLQHVRAVLSVAH